MSLGRPDASHARSSGSVARRLRPTCDAIRAVGGFPRVRPRGASLAKTLKRAVTRHWKCPRASRELNARGLPGDQDFLSYNGRTVSARATPRAGSQVSSCFSHFPTTGRGCAACAGDAARVAASEAIRLRSTSDITREAGDYCARGAASEAICVRAIFGATRARALLRLGSQSVATARWRHSGCRGLSARAAQCRQPRRNLRMTGESTLEIAMGVPGSGVFL